MWNLIKKSVGFVKDVVVTAVKTIVNAIKDIIKNIFAVTILVGSTVGFTSLYASTALFGLASISFIVPIMIAPILASLTVVGLLAAMNVQLMLEGVSI